MVKRRTIAAAGSSTNLLDIICLFAQVGMAVFYLRRVVTLRKEIDGVSDDVITQ